MLHDWTNFFDITAATGGQLIGLLFVVVTLATGLSASQHADALRAFITPTLVNFSGVLLQALVVLAPWRADWPMGLILILGGLAGVGYRLYSIGLKRKLDFVALHGVDWMAYNGVPVLANTGLIAGGAGLMAGKPFAPYAIAGGSVLLLVAGIYGAWDLTLFIVQSRDKT
jgi:hypothetical protein